MNNARRSIWLRSLCFCMAVTGLAVSASPASVRDYAVLRPGVSAWIQALENDPSLAQSPRGQVALDQLLWAGEVSLFIDSTSLPGDASTARQSIDQAWQTWNALLRDETQFSRAPRRETATVVIHLRPRVYHKGVQSAGLASWERRDGDPPSQIATIWVGTLDQEGQPLSPAAIQHIAMHEIGHLIGLDDAPQSPGVMGWIHLEKPAAGPSLEEVRLVQATRARILALREKAR